MNIERRKLGPQVDDLDIAEDLATELMPGVRNELDREIANQRDPVLKRVLLDQRAENQQLAAMVDGDMQAHVFGGKTHYFPASMSVEKIGKALKAWKAQQPRASQGDVRSFESQQSPRRATATSPEELFNSWMQATGGQLQPGQTQEQAIAAWASTKPEVAPEVDYTSPEAIAGHPLVRAALGAASPFIGLVQLLANIAEMTGVPGQPGELVNEYLARLQKMKDEGRLQAGSEGFDFADLAGTALSPAFLWAATAKVPVSYLLKVAQGGAFGAAAGATAPITDGGHNFVDDKIKQVETGTAFGALAPAVLTPAKAVGKWIHNAVIEPHAPKWLGGNQEAIKGRAILEATGNKTDEVEAALRKAEEFVPGTKPTAGQAATEAGSAEFSAFAKSAERAKPTQYNDLRKVQNEARRAHLQTVGKDEATLEAAEAARKASTDTIYDKAYKVVVKTDPALRRLWGTPYFRKALPKAWEIAEQRGFGPAQVASGKKLTEFLHLVKVGLDEQLSAGPATGSTALNGMEKRAVVATKEKLLDWLKVKNPAYEAARKSFAQQSDPINRMKVGQYLEEKLVPAIADDGVNPIARQSATQFVNARRDAAKTIAQSDIGGPRFEKLKQVLKPDEVQVVDDIYNDLQRNANFEELAKAGRGSGPNALDLATPGAAPQVFSRGVTIFNAIMRRLEGKLNKKLAAEIAAEMANPIGIADSLAKAKAKAAFNAGLADKIQRYGIRHSAAVSAHAPEQAKELYGIVNDALTSDEE
jgi:hypothetical protein